MNKNLLITLLFSFTAVVMYSQSQRLAFVEEFTQASCPPCEQTTPMLNETLNANTDKVVQLRYQTSWPGVDPMNADNPEEVQTRVDYYGVTGVPTLYLDGAEPVGPVFPELITQANIDDSYGSGSPIGITLSHTLSEDLKTMDVSIEIANEGTEAYDLATDKLRVALIEELITWSSPPGSTSITVFDGVMKTFFTTPAGMDLDAIMPGESWTNTWEGLEIPNTIYDYRQLAVVAFVQDDADKSVVNSALSHPQAIEGAIDLAVQAELSTSSDLCDYNLTPSISIVNTTDADAEGGYTATMSLNGTVIEEITGDETVAAGSSLDLAFQAIELPAGSSTIAVAVEANGVDVFGQNNSTEMVIGKATSPLDNYSQDYESEEIDQYPSNGLVNVPFDVLNFKTVNSAFLGVDQNVGGFGESDNCLMINFWNWNPSNVDGNGDMIILDQYMVTSEAPMFNFSHAFTPWGGSNDALSIDISTDCGQTFTSIFSAAGADLATAPELMDNYEFFIPAVDEWQANEVDLSSYIGEVVMIKISVTSAWGDMLYIDDIAFSGVSGTEDLVAGSLKVFPNPATDIATIELQLEETNNVSVSLINAVGQQVSTVNYGKQTGYNQYKLDVSNVSAGVYFININIDEEVVTKRITIVE